MKWVLYTLTLPTKIILVLAFLGSLATSGLLAESDQSVIETRYRISPHQTDFSISKMQELLSKLYSRKYTDEQRRSTLIKSIEKHQFESPESFLFSINRDTVISERPGFTPIGYFDSAVWLHIKIPKENQNGLDYLNLYCQGLCISYQIEQRKIINRSLTGRWLPTSLRENRDFGFYMNLTIPLEPTEEHHYELIVYKHLAGEYFALNSYLISQEKLGRKFQRSFAYLLIFIAATGILFLYNFGIFVLVHEAKYLSYCSYLLATVFGIVYISDNVGWFLGQTLFSPHWLFAAICLAMIAVMSFTMEYLQLRTKLPRLYKRAIQIRYLFFCFPLLLPFSTIVLLNQISSLVSLVGATANLYVLFRATVGKIRQSYYLTTAFTVAGVGVYFYLAYILGYSGWGEESLNFVGLMIILEMLILSLAMGDKINVLARQMTAANLELKDKNKELSLYSHHLDDLVQAKTKDIASILTNMGQGLVSISGSGLEFGSNYSEAAAQILNCKELYHQDADKLLFSRLTLSDDQREQLKQILTSSIAEHEINFIANQSKLPRKVCFLRSETEKIYLDFDWSIDTNEEGIVEKILLVFKDTTEFQKLEESKEQVEKNLLKLSKLLQFKPVDIYRFIDRGLKFTETMKQSLAMNTGSKTPDRHLILFEVHTLKGQARFLDQIEIQDRCHHIENLMIQDTSDPSDPNANEWNAIYQEFIDLEKSLLEVRDLMNSKMQWFQVDSDDIRMESSQVETIVDSLIALLKKAPPDLHAQLQTVYELVAQYYYKPLDGIYSSFEASIRRLARELGKPEPIIQTDFKDIKVRPHCLVTLKDMLVHLIRNSIDHGFSEYDSKNTKNHVFISADRREDGIYIEYSDDGVGLDLQHIREIGIRRKIIERRDKTSAEDIAMLIFANGFSTKSSSDAMSGRGVGMSAVLNFSRELGGTCTIRLLNKQPDLHRKQNFVVIIKLPHDQAEITSIQTVQEIKAANAS